MGWLSKIAGGIWTAAKKTVSYAWNHVVRPVIETVVKFVGGFTRRVGDILYGIEGAALAVVEVLEKDVGQIIREALDRAQSIIENLLLRHLGEWGAILTITLEELTAALDGRPLDDRVAERESRRERAGREV